MASSELGLEGLQSAVDGWIAKNGVRYFDQLTNMAVLSEEVGEVARIIAREYGDQSWKEDSAQQNLGDELADVMFVVCCLANQCGVDLEAVFKKRLSERAERDRNRHLNNAKL